MQTKTRNILQGLSGAGDVARALKINRSTVWRIANAHRIGQFVAGRRLFSLEDVEQIKEHCHWQAGNPNFGKKVG